MSIRSQLRETRELLKLSKEKISRQSGISAGMISAYEKGLKDMTGEKIESYAHAVGKRVVLIDENL